MHYAVHALSVPGGWITCHSFIQGDANILQALIDVLVSSKDCAME